MDTYPLFNKNGQVFAFEIDNVYIGVKKIAALLGIVQGVSNIRVRKLFGTNSDIHIEFTYLGKSYIVWEPYADNSRYWIGPKNENEFLDVSKLQNIFEQYKPALIIKIIGDIFSFRFLKHKKHTGSSPAGRH